MAAFQTTQSLIQVASDPKRDHNLDAGGASDSHARSYVSEQDRD